MFKHYMTRFYSNDSKYVNSALAIYKFLLRECEKLPPDACNHYKFAVKQSFKQHKSESDQDRIKEIINKSIEDAKWIVNKYTKK